MATVDKNFKVKNGLVVEGTTATVNGNDILTTASTTDQLNEGTTNLFFTEQRAIDAVGGSATSGNTPNTVVKRDGFGNFAASQIDLDSKLTAPLVQFGNAGEITGNTNDLVLDAYSMNDLIVRADNNVTIQTNYADINLNPDGNVKIWGNVVATQGYADTVSSSAQTAAQSYADSLAVNYDPVGSAATAQANANLYTDGKVSALVDSAPDLLNTLNELAAAIADNPNYATDVANLVATKADKTYVDSQDSALDTAAQGYATTALNSAKSYADGLAVNYDAAGAAATAETNAKTYAKNYADGLAANYDAAGSATAAETAAKAYADSLAANYDAAGSAIAAEGNAKAYADSLAINYDPAGSAASAQTSAISSANSYTDSVISSGNISATPSYAAIKLGYYATEVAGYTAGNTGVALTAYTFSAGIKSGKFIVRVMSNATGDSQMSEILVTADNLNNVAITEYAIVSTNGNMGDVTADVDGSGNIRIIVTPTHDNSEVMVSGTVFIWND